MLLHKIAPKLCVEKIHLDENILECSQCGRYIGYVFQERLWLRDDFRKFRKEIQESSAVAEYTKKRDKMDEDTNREWRDFLRDLKFNEDEIFSLETTDEWIPEDCEWGDTAGCS